MKSIFSFILEVNTQCTLFFIPDEINKMKKAVILLAAFSAFAGAQEQAVEKDVSGFYLGGGFGTTTYDDDAALSTLETNDSTFKLIGICPRTPLWPEKIKFSLMIVQFFVQKTAG